MNITLAVDEKIVERAREVARQQGTSLNALIREYLEKLAGQRSGADLARDITNVLVYADDVSAGAASRAHSCGD